MIGTILAHAAKTILQISYMTKTTFTEIVLVQMLLLKQENIQTT